MNREIKRVAFFAALSMLLASGCVGRLDDDPDAGPDGSDHPRCGNGEVEAGEECDDGNLRDGDGCDAHCRLPGCGDDCECSPQLDVTDLIDSNVLFYGEAALGIDFSSPGCGDGDSAREIYVSFTPDFDGALVLSTAHPSTTTETVLEVREESCDGAGLDCSAGTDDPPSRAWLEVSVESGIPMVAMVETADDETGQFALGLHPPGVCEGLGLVEEISDRLLSGVRFAVDTTDSTATMRGSCSAERDGNPEALLTFTPPRPGTMVATTAHPATGFNTLLHLRAGRPTGQIFCDSPEAEVDCVNDSEPWGTDPVLRFDAAADRTYSLFVDGGSADGRGAATVTLGYQEESPFLTSLEGCDHEGLRDRFAFFAEEGQVVSLLADTADHATAADLRLMIYSPGGGDLHEADDDVDCTYPPPEFTCPQYRFTTFAGGLYSVDVYVGRNERCADTTGANYELTVTVGGEQVELIQIRDD